VNQQTICFLVIATAIVSGVLGYVWGARAQVGYFRRGWEAAARSYTGEDLNS
jgi:hypothetical protein